MKRLLKPLDHAALQSFTLALQTPITTQHLSCASTSQRTQDPSRVDTGSANGQHSLSIAQNQTTQMWRAGPGTYQGNANSHVALVLQVEVPDEEYDSPANGRMCRQCTTSGSVPDHRRMQGPEYEAENHLESGTDEVIPPSAVQIAHHPQQLKRPERAGTQIIHSLASRNKVTHYKIKWQDLLNHFHAVQIKHEKAHRQALSTDNLPFSGFDSKSGDPASASSSHGSHPPLQHRVTGDTAPPPGLPQPPVLSPVCEAERLAGVDVDGPSAAAVTA
ncbi:hypothetical protein BU15DRAFT_64957 [Melanogaster broomeanus]|nr:hypothetical protein BU15DRAFT_64957 [Melanogaster broomeanus]